MSEPYEAGCYVEGLQRDLSSAQSTCAKLHDLNHMQAQRIEVLEAQCETRAKRIYELEQERIALCEGNRLAGGYWKAKYAELEEQPRTCVNCGCHT